MRFVLALFLTFAMLAPAYAASTTAATAPAAVIGQPAPDFTATDTAGKAIKLSDYKGKTIVLEWTNHECPYVRKHYDAGNMQKVQAQAAQQGVVWLRVISSAPGKQGNLKPADAVRIAQENDVTATATLLDESGAVGRLYGAKTTPHMFVIGTDGTLVYAGAIDDKPTSDPASLDTAKNYVKTVLDDIHAGRPVSVAQSMPYGCGVKYAD